ncbi:IPTL-CTERM sorting domain-containing protein, partial [Comamonadaceae bacterium OH2545_COT-014]
EVQITQAGNANYTAATPVTYRITFTAAGGAGAGVTAVPTLGHWSLMLLGLAAAGLGARRLRRRP